jgi:hypothetical protein
MRQTRIAIESMRETRHIIDMMQATGNRAGVIAQWKEAVADWAQRYRTDPDAAAVNAWLPLWQPRPFYTVEELAPMWPALAIATGFTNQWPAVPKSPVRLAHELDFYGLPRLRADTNYFVCERAHYWRDKTREDILREIPHAFG